MTSTFCDSFNLGLCRSCEWIEQDYPSQLLRKTEILKKTLSFFPSFEVEPSVECPPTGFRNRAKMSVTGTIEHPIIGLLGEENLDAGRELLSCPIHHPRINELLALLPEWIHKAGLEPYRIRERQGELKGLIAFYSPDNEQMYLRFILRSHALVARLKKLLPELQHLFPRLVCVSANIQPVPHAVLEGPEEILFTEKKHLDLRLGPVTLRLAPQAFVQTNLRVATALYQTAAEWIAAAHPARMLELFCGQGAFSFFAAAAVPRILGIEINTDAVIAATQTAQELGFTHLQFKKADATQADTELQEFSPDLVLVNPPRKGLGQKGIRLLQKNLPQHLIYSSCDVETLGEDLAELRPHYPQIRRAQIFDMFPHTRHFETLIWVERGADWAEG
ncbi:methyltransferase domain-containing protein [Bdellovibrionota bacterium FG-1]